MPAFEQLPPEMRLELRDLFADGGLRDAQFLRRFGKAAVTGGDRKNPKGIQRGKRSHSIPKTITRSEFYSFVIENLQF